MSYANMVLVLTGAQCQIDLRRVVSIDAWPGADVGTVQSLSGSSGAVDQALAWDVRSPHGSEYRSGAIVTLTMWDGSRLDVRHGHDSPDALAARLGLVEVVADMRKRVRTWVLPPAGVTQRGSRWYTLDGHELVKAPSIELADEPVT